MNQNKFLLLLALAKCFQARQMHDQAIELFISALETKPNDAFALFRRAWSYKVKLNILASIILVHL